MSNNSAAMFYASLYNKSITLAAQTACTTRAPTVTASLAAANIIAFVPTDTVDRNIDSISYKGCSSAFTAPTAAQTITIWHHDGTTAWPIKELEIEAVTPSTSAKSAEKTFYFDELKLVANTDSLYVSTSITTTASTTAMCLHARGGKFA